MMLKQIKKKYNKPYIAIVLWVCMAIGSMSAGCQYYNSEHRIQDQQAFVHPGLMQTEEDLVLMKKKIDTDEEPWRTAWDNLLNESYSSLDFIPEPRAHIVRGSYGRPNIGADEFSNSGKAAYSHALQWYVTGEQANANKAIEILNAWSDKLWDFQQNDAKILVGWTGSDFINAAEILRYSDSGWTEADMIEFERMLRTVFYSLIKDFFPEANGNWDAAMMHTMISMGVYLDDHNIFNKAVNHFLRGPVNAGITKYIYPHGQSQESTRDQPHTQMGLDYLSRTALVAWNQGVDLYESADNRLALGFEYTAKYMHGNEVFTYGGPISPQGRDRFRDNFEAAYQHYHYVKGLEMPYTMSAIDSTRATGFWGVLTQYRGPGSISPEILDPPRPAAQAPEAGARNQLTADPPGNAISVAPGESIQDALDERNREGGGWVILEKGVYSLSEALHVSSGVTLAGKGIETILFLDPELVTSHSAAIVNAENDMNDITIRDLLIEGATSVTLPNDPNQARRQRSHQLNPSRAGIIFAAQEHGQMSNLRFEHVTVQNHTHNGVAIYGAADVEIISCDFSDNGSSVVPGPGLQHNLLITRVTGLEVRDSRFDTSPWGSGVDVTHSHDVEIINSETARNRLYGIRIAESEKIRVLENLVEGNDGGGIMFDVLMDGNRNIEVIGNIVQNNGGKGVIIDEGTGDTVQDNILRDNGNFDENETSKAAFYY